MRLFSIEFKIVIVSLLNFIAGCFKSLLPD